MATVFLIDDHPLMREALLTLLRRIDRERETIAPAVPADPLDALAQEYSHPRWVVQRWAERWGLESTRSLLGANNAPASIVVRPYGIEREPLEGMLQTAGVDTHDVPLLADSVRLSGTVALTELGAFKQGAFYVQDPAATLVVIYAHVPQGGTVADLCAAPGSKALELSRRAGLVIAADRNAARVQRMVQGFARLHAARLQVLVADATQPALTPVDAVLVDVPCTGTGTFRRHPDARWRLRVSDFAVVGALQKKILCGAATLVKPGGLLVYSTCSLELEENDEQIRAFLQAHPEFTLDPPPAGVVPASVLDGGILRVLPHLHGFDGAYAARLRRAA